MVFPILESIFDSVTYNCTKGFSSQYIVDMDMLGLPDFIKFDDSHNFSSCIYIHACYRGNTF